MAELGTVKIVSIDSEMRSSYLDYAMSVIVQRALPDVRDGLKPVQRRILYAMHDEGLRPGTSYRKSAGAVGEVLKKYHPHGDVSVYDALVRMVQDFVMRYPLIDGQGNYGSMDGDSAAAMRYCVTNDTLVATNSGLVRIDRLSDGAEDIDVRVLSRGGEVNTASKWFDCGEHPTRRVRTRRGYEVTGTLNHPLLVCVRGDAKRVGLVWKTIDRIEPGDYLVLDRSEALWPEKPVDLAPYHPEWPERSRAQRHALPTQLNEELAFLLGALLAEGTFRPLCIEFTNTLGDFADAFERTWQSVFPSCRLHLFDRAPTSYGKRPFRQMQIVSRYVLAFLRNLGLVGRSAERQLPEVILRSPQAVAASFLRGLFEGDGSVERSGRSLLRVSLCASNEALLKQVQILLLRFGIVSALSLDQTRHNHRLLIVGQDNLLRFERLIGFASVVKREALAQVLQLHTGQALARNDFVPFLADFVRETAIRHQSWLKRNNFDRPSRLAEALPRLMEALPAADAQEVASLARAGYLFEPVVSVEDAGMQRVYSIRVDSPCHSFVANGFINHNTECRLAPIAAELIADIDSDTVDFRPNYDDREQEPSVLPARLPNLLLNGVSGIAVGMATNIPPHNLTELCNGITYLIDHPEATVEELAEIITGPDFPTGGLILGREGILQAYATGRGRVILRAKAYTEEARGNRYQIVVTEVPYMVNKSSLLEKIAALVKEGKLDGISDLRDESDRSGVRVVFELKRDAQPIKVLNNLYKHTPLQITFGVNMLALVDGKQPRVLTLKMVLHHYIEHRQQVLTRRTQHELTKARQRAHILEGLRIALDHIDAVIATIRNSRTTDSARNNLMTTYKLTEVQATAILDLQLRRLAALERKKIDDEYKDLLREIKRLEGILADPKQILALIKADLAALREKYGDERRSRIIADATGDLTDDDLIPDVGVLVTITERGYIKRLPPDTYRLQGRGGRGVAGMSTREADTVQHIIGCNTMDSLLFFTNRGRVFVLRAHELPDASRTAKGMPVINFIGIQPDERVTTLLAVPDFDLASYLVMCTRQGTIKRTALAAYAAVRANGLIAINLDAGDELLWVRLTSGRDQVIISTRDGKAIRFKEDDVRPMGRTAAGVIAIKLAAGDQVAAMEVVDLTKDLLVVSEHGYGKRTPLTDYPLQGRAGQGVITMKLTDKTGKIVSARVVEADAHLMLISTKGTVIRIDVAKISQLSRGTQGVRLQRLSDGTRVASVEPIDPTELNGDDT